MFMVKLITLLASLIFASLAHGAPASPVHVDQVMRRPMETSMQGQQLAHEQRRVMPKH